mgnify:CR=1 FL=1
MKNPVRLRICIHALLFISILYAGGCSGGKEDGGKITGNSPAVPDPYGDSPSPAVIESRPLATLPSTRESGDEISEILEGRPPTEQAEMIVGFLCFSLITYRCHLGHFPSEQEGSLFTPESITDPQGFVGFLVRERAGQGSTPGKRLWELLPQSARDLIEASSAGTTVNLQVVTEAMNSILRLPDFFQENWKTDLNLPEEAQWILLNDLKTLPESDLLRLNRLVLATVYPEIISAGEPEGLWALAAHPRKYAPEKYLIDPWGKPYQYRWLNGPEMLYELYSLGPDGTASEDDIRLSGIPAKADFAKREFVENLIRNFERLPPEMSKRE